MVHQKTTACLSGDPDPLILAPLAAAPNLSMPGIEVLGDAFSDSLLAGASQ